MRVAKAYLAGTGATTALFAAGLVSFLSLAALLSFDGLPSLGGGSEGGSVFVGPATSAPEAAAAAAAGTATAVAVAPAGAPGAAGGAGGAAGGGSAGGGTGVPGGGLPGTTDGSGTVPGVTPPGTTPPGGSPAPSTTSGPVSNTVQTLDSTTENATGLDLPLTETTSPITDKLDKTVDGAVGGLLGP